MKNASILCVASRMVLGCGVLFAATVTAEPTKTLLDAEWQITVPSGETYALTAEDVAELGANALRKLGDGTLTVDGVLAEFTGDIHVNAGVYKALKNGSLGTNAGQTYVDGGTLWNVVQSGTSGADPSFGTEHIHLKGTGFDNRGALQNEGKDACSFCKKVTLDGDARITLKNRLDFRSTAFDMGGHTLTTFSSNDAMFFLVQVNISNPGAIVAESGGLEYQSYVNGFASTNTVSLGQGAKLSLWNSTTKQPGQLALGANTRLYSSNGTYSPGAYSVNVWNGPVTLSGATRNELSVNAQIAFAGAVSGAGGFTGGNGGWLQFVNGANTFAGGIDLTGTAPANCCPTGGVVVYANGAVPRDGGALKLKNAQLQIYSASQADLPDFIADGAVKASAHAGLTNATVKTLTKTGAGVLDLDLPLRVRGDADFQGGTVRFGAHVPTAAAGLSWYWGTGGGANTNPTSPTKPCQGVDKTGAGYAYRAWSDVAGYSQEHCYAGYIRVPGEEGETVTCNFISSIARTTMVRIGDKWVIKFCDQTDHLTGAKITTWTRFWMNGQTTLTAGWHPILVYMGNWHDSTRGPVENKALGWTANFGIGVDWQGRCETNTANYVKLLDPGDGSFLRYTMDEKDALDPAIYRPTFAGAVKFGSGTVLDVNDSRPYTPVVFPSLTGLFTLTNGLVRVSDPVWTIRAADIAGGKPMTIADGARLEFPFGATFALADEDDIPHGAVKTYPLLRIQGTGEFVNSPTYGRVRGSKWFAEWSGDGKSLDLVYHDGFAIFLR